MTHVITSLCVRDGGCVTVCPVECIIPGKPTDEWPLFYIDPDTCIDCGACIPECPFEAIFPEDEVPTALKVKAGQVLSKPVGTPGFAEVYNGSDHESHPVHLKATRTLKAGEVLDLTPDTEVNSAFFKEGPGYNASK
jgi:ferredoxin